MDECVLVTGGAGYIGSHSVLALLEARKRVVVLDNLSNSSREAITRVSLISGQTPVFVEGDVRDRAALRQVFKQYRISSVLHFAGLKAVGESVLAPLEYYDNNLCGTLNLCLAMREAQVFNLVFSSSATVYGHVDKVPIAEDAGGKVPTNPYGRTKLAAEELLRDLGQSDPRWSIALLRYFNPVGAHESGLIGEDPNGIPNNLVPYISQVAIGKLEALSVYGQDYPTRDGTGVRDYIHVVDLADGHVKALQALSRSKGVHVWNLGTGKGYSVLEIVRAFERACGRTIPCRMVARRPGDIAECWADACKSELELGWKARRGLEQMMADTWRWQRLNPEGYSTLAEAVAEPARRPVAHSAQPVPAGAISST